jgi:hypothetical protein
MSLEALWVLWRGGTGRSGFISPSPRRARRPAHVNHREETGGEVAISLRFGGRGLRYTGA